MRLATLKKRSDFQRVRGGGRCSLLAFVMEGKARVDGSSSGPRFGFTVTKKLGGAVQRNRIRRRLKAAISVLSREQSDPRFDYVIVAREAALDLEFTRLSADLTIAFRRVHEGPRPAPAQSPRRKAGDARELDRRK